MGAGHGRQRDEIDDINEELEKHIFFGYRDNLQFKDKRRQDRFKRQDLFNSLPDDMIKKIEAERFRKDVEVNHVADREETSRRKNDLQRTRRQIMNPQSHNFDAFALQNLEEEPEPNLERVREIDRQIEREQNSFREKSVLYNRQVNPLREMGYL